MPGKNRLSKTGRIAVELPSDEWEGVIREAKKLGLAETFTKSDVIRVLLKAARKKEVVEETMIIPIATKGPLNKEPMPVMTQQPEFRGSTEQGVSPRLPSSSQPILLTWAQTMAEWKGKQADKRNDLRTSELVLEKEKLEFRERAWGEMLDFKREELGLKRHFLELKAQREERWMSGFRQGALPSVPLCTFCSQGNHLPVNCPELKKLRETWPVRQEA